MIVERTLTSGYIRRLLRRIVERWDELEARECSRHEFAALMQEVEEVNREWDRQTSQ